MKNTAKKTCTRCCPEGETWTSVHDRATAEDGSPVWACRCCGTEQPRRVRRSAVQVKHDRDPEARASYDALVAELMANLD